MTVRYRYIGALVLALVLLACSGCANTFPRDHGSRVAEKTWLVLHAVDTAQTVQIARHPQCFREANPAAAFVYGSDQPKAQRVLLTNLALGLVHTRVSRWFDDGYERARLRENGTPGPWAVGRIMWHTVSIVGTGAAVANNFSQGIGVTSARCP